MKKEDYRKLQGELNTMKMLNLKVNYSQLGRMYNLDPRTIRKYDNGYEGKPKNRVKKSKLCNYIDEITEKLNIPRSSIKGIYENFIDKYGYKNIGSYSNFRIFINKHLLIEKRKKRDTSKI